MDRKVCLGHVEYLVELAYYVDDGLLENDNLLFVRKSIWKPCQSY